jgi:glyoxylase-like metal-dependent hydrolase (beta-lactamase superfamily II)
MSYWQIGEIKIHRIFDLLQDPVVAEGFFVGGATAAQLLALRDRYPHAINEHGQLLLSYHGFLVETPSAAVLVDTGVGSDKERGLPEFDRRRSPFLSHLAEIGLAPADISAVVCTHLHFDHVGGCTQLVDDTWVPVFPGAPVYISGAELDHWRVQDSDPVHRIAWQDSVQPLLDAKAVVAVDELPFDVAPGVTLVPTGGHTPGHISVEVRSAGELGLITGDMTHHPAQLHHPHWGVAFDVDCGRGTQSRLDVYERLAGSGGLLFGTHFMPPSAGRVRREGTAYRLDPVPPGN